MSKKCVIGVDLGGTKILTAAADLKGKILYQVKVDTEAKNGPYYVIGNIIKSVVLSLKGAKLPLKSVQKICIGAPGPIIYEKGIIVSPPNLPGWKKIDLKSRLEKVFNKPVILDNDANLAAFAEAKIGAGKGKQNVIYITVSTGIGGGIVINGQLYRGSIGTAGEVGHTIIQKNGPKCGCGNNGCLEAMGSGTAMANLARISAGKGSLMLKLAGGKRSNIDALVVEKAARKGDGLANKIIREIGENIGIGMANLVNIFNPDVIVIGGGISNMKELIFKPIRDTVNKYALSISLRRVKVVRAKLGTKAGLVGAILSCLKL